MPDFDDALFPLHLSSGSSGGPRFSTSVIVTASGREYRNQNWAEARMRYNAARGVRTPEERDTLIDFFYARRGRARSFPLRDWADYKSVGPREAVSAIDQEVGVGDGTKLSWQLIKTYPSGYTRVITKPVPETVLIALDGVEQASGWSVDRLSGLVTFDTAPAEDVSITAGYEFDVPVRFDSDSLEISYLSATAKEVMDIPIVEVDE